MFLSKLFKGTWLRIVCPNKIIKSILHEKKTQKEHVVQEITKPKIYTKYKLQYGIVKEIIVEKR